MKEWAWAGFWRWRAGMENFSDEEGAGRGWLGGSRCGKLLIWRGGRGGGGSETAGTAGTADAGELGFSGGGEECCEQISRAEWWACRVRGAVLSGCGEYQSLHRASCGLWLRPFGILNSRGSHVSRVTAL